MSQIMAAAGDIASVIQEAVAPGIEDWLVHKADPVAMDLYTTSRGVKESSFGPGYVHQRVYQDGLSGVAWAQDALGADEANVLATTVGYSAGSPYPGLDEWRDASTFRRTTALVRITGNVILPLDVLRGNALDTAVGDVVASRIRSESKRISHMRTNWLYADTDNSIGTVASVTPGTGGTGVSVCTITLTRARARQLPGGMHLEVWTSDLSARRHSAATALSSSKAFCVVVQYDARSETLQLSLLNGALWASQVAAGDKIFLQQKSSDAGTTMAVTNRVVAPYGLYDQIKSTGTLWGENGQSGISLDDRPNFASLVVDNGAVYLSEDKLHSVFGQFDDRLGDLTEVDSAVTTNGVMVGLLNNQSGSETRERNGFVRKTKMGWTVFSFTYGGREVDIKISRCLPKGHFTAYKAGEGNFEQFVPPGLAREREDGSVIPDVKFVGPELGMPDIFMPVLTSSGAPTDYKQAPFNMFLQTAFAKPMGIDIHNISEDLVSG